MSSLMTGQEPASRPVLASHRSSPINAITLATHDMARAVRFYQALGFTMRYGGAVRRSPVTSSAQAI